MKVDRKNIVVGDETTATGESKVVISRFKGLAGLSTTTSDKELS